MTTEDLDKKRARYLTFLTQQPKGFVYNDPKGALKLLTVAPSTTTASKQQSLDTLKRDCKDCTKCPLGAMGRKQVVFGNGSPDTLLMFVGEGPGKDEDVQGLPFVGRSGQLFTKIIEAMGMSRDQVYISNVVKCRPPDNRIPLPIERSTCKELLLFKEIEVVKPKIICTLGATATQALLGDDIKITQARGLFFEWRGYLVLPTYHPAYLLRNPAEKRTVWEDMKKIITKLAEFQ